MSAPTCLAVMYHYVRDSAATDFPAIRALPPSLFAEQLDWLQREFDLIGPDDLEAALDSPASLPAKTAVLTFDDGVMDHYTTVFPMLRDRGLSGVFFLSLDACAASPRMLGVHKTHFLLARLGAGKLAHAVLEECDRAASPDGKGRAGVFGADRWEHADERAIKDLLNYELPFEKADAVLDTLFGRHIRPPDMFAGQLYLREPMVTEMARAGMRFGYHTRSHRMLARLTPADQQAELRDGASWIRALTGQTRVSFCYPWGGKGTYTRETCRLVAEAGYSMAFNTVRRRIAIGEDGRFELPRVDTRDLPPYTSSEPAASRESALEDA